MKRADQPDLSFLEPELSMIGDENLRARVVQMWTELWGESNWEEITQVPVASHIDRPQVFHTRSVVRSAVAIATILEETHNVGLDRDLLIAAALVQDASKVAEYQLDGEGKVARSAIGTTMGHGPYGAIVAHRVGMPLEVINVILSHSPDAVLQPATLEAKILAQIDQISVAALGGDRFVTKAVRYR